MSYYQPTFKERIRNEMEKSPCLFRQEYYRTYSKESGFHCTLTATRITGHEPQFEKCCRPEKCPIWKTYIMQLETNEKLTKILNK